MPSALKLNSSITLKTSKLLNTLSSKYFCLFVIIDGCIILVHRRLCDNVSSIADRLATPECVICEEVFTFIGIFIPVVLRSITHFCLPDHVIYVRKILKQKYQLKSDIKL